MRNKERRQGARQRRTTWTWSGEAAGPCLPVLEVIRAGPESKKNTETVVPETVAPETMAPVTVALNSIGQSRSRPWARRAGRSACPRHLASRQGKYQRGSGRGAEPRRRYAQRRIVKSGRRGYY